MSMSSRFKEKTIVGSHLLGCVCSCRAWREMNPESGKNATHFCLHTTAAAFFTSGVATTGELLPTSQTFKTAHLWDPTVLSLEPYKVPGYPIA
eukprot:2335558-Rhodomonas_salina.1